MSASISRIAQYCHVYRIDRVVHYGHAHVPMSASPIFEPVRDRFARNLKTWRHKRGLSQESLAEQAGISRGYLSCVETSTETISLDNAVEIARVLKIDIVDLLRP